MIYCTLLNPALDVIYRINEFRSGNTVTDIPSFSIPAGKGINVARVVRTLGEDVCVVGLMPEYDMKRSLEFLDQLKIKHHLFAIPGGLRINTTLIEENTNFNSHINSAGQQLPLRIQLEFNHFLEEFISAGDLWCFSGSLPRGFENDCYQKLIKSCKNKGAITLLDSRDHAFKMGVRAKPLMIKPNISELEGFFDEQIKGVHHLALKGKRLVDMGIAYVFISLGADGMIAIHENDCLLCSAPQIKTLDTVGCGDALVGGILVAQKRNFSFSEMCRMAIACGSSKALHQGPGVVSLDEVWQLMEEVTITAV
ncbi:MAG: 1-phosphofructokinase family hexose kinase [Fibrobacter sp.]|nr:1-phosphofructokinase family hexose kinase [Fibrobacter sp.]